MAAQTIGIFGGGQLGRMMAQAALPLNIRCIFYESQHDCPARALGTIFESEQLTQFAQQADVYTLEFENTKVSDTEALLIEQKTLFPPVQALATAQNRLTEKALFDALDIPVAPYRQVDCFEDLVQAVAALGLPLVLKTATGGYDGKGQLVVHSEHDMTQAWQLLGTALPLVAESFVKFSREVSIIAVRSQQGEIRTWDLAENHHHEGILSHSIVPAPDSDDLYPQAQRYITRVLEHLDYVGVLTLELFVTEHGLLANEMAPRVHNSGHWSIEGAVCSQFENHIRAVAGLPLGDTATVRPTVMVNIIGRYPQSEQVLQLAGAHLHLYDKTEREGRKLGHITLMPMDHTALPDLCRQLAHILPEPLALPR